MDKLQFLVIISLIFVVGWVSATVYSFYDFELLPENNGGKKLTQPFFGIIGLNAKEIPSPADHVDESDIVVYPDRVTFYVEDPRWTGFYDTNSMDPLLDAESDVIEITPGSEEDINVGDVVSYVTEDGYDVVHRVIEIDEDEQGTFYTTKGDNNIDKDPEKVRYEQITGIIVAVFY